MKGEYPELLCTPIIPLTFPASLKTAVHRGCTNCSTVVLERKSLRKKGGHLRTTDEMKAGRCVFAP
jgi:hypothetical protein